MMGRINSSSPNPCAIAYYKIFRKNSYSYHFTTKGVFPLHDIVFRIILFLCLLVFAAWCIYMGITSRPHKLKKAPISLFFSKQVPHTLGTPVHTLYNTKTDFFAAALCGCLLITCIAMLLNGYGSLLYLVPCCLGIGYNIWLATRKLLLYENAIVVSSLTGQKIYFLDEIDYLCSYNVVNIFNHGISYGYRLIRNNTVSISLPKTSFKEIDVIEEFYRQSPYLINPA